MGRSSRSRRRWRIRGHDRLIDRFEIQHMTARAMVAHRANADTPSSAAAADGAAKPPRPQAGARDARSESMLGVRTSAGRWGVRLAALLARPPCWEYRGPPALNC